MSFHACVCGRVSPLRYVRAHIDTARGDAAPGQLSDANKRLAYLKRTEPEGELRMVKSKTWGPQNPFHILMVSSAVIGFG